MLPDVVQDAVTDCARRRGFQYTEQVFYLASLEVGYKNNAEDKARELDNIWKMKGYEALPSWAKDFCERTSLRH